MVLLKIDIMSVTCDLDSLKHRRLNENLWGKSENKYSTANESFYLNIVQYTLPFIYFYIYEIG